MHDNWNLKKTELNRFVFVFAPQISILLRQTSILPACPDCFSCRLDVSHFCFQFNEFPLLLHINSLSYINIFVFCGLVSSVCILVRLCEFKVMQMTVILESLKNVDFFPFGCFR